MKQLLLLAACGWILAAACQPVADRDAAQETGSMLVSVSGIGLPATKSNTEPAGKDAYLHDVQVFIFQLDGSLYRRETFPENVSSRSIDGVKAGYYNLVAVANGPDLSAVKTRAELEQQAIALSLNDPERGFIMYGAAPGNVTVSSSSDTPARVSIELRRFVSRVRLTTVQNKLPSDCGSLKVEGVFLSNVLSAWTWLASADPTGYINHAGRKAGRSTSTSESDFIVGSADAECPALTFRTLDRTVARSENPETIGIPLYAFPNKLTANEDHFSGPTADAACTRMVLVVSYGSNAERWYYPVTIPSMERNTSYDVAFIISGPGTKDPNQRVSNGNLDVEVSIGDWGNGSEFLGDF
jgi:hypothetical protein